MKYIMLHGLGQSSESWSDTVKVFNDDFEVLCPNLSDWLSGKTPCYDTLYRTLETYCEQFEEILELHLILQQLLKADQGMMRT